MAARSERWEDSINGEMTQDDMDRNDDGVREVDSAAAGGEPERNDSSEPEAKQDHDDSPSITRTPGSSYELGETSPPKALQEDVNGTLDADSTCAVESDPDGFDTVEQDGAPKNDDSDVDGLAPPALCFTITSATPDTTLMDQSFVEESDAKHKERENEPPTAAWRVKRRRLLYVSLAVLVLLVVVAVAVLVPLSLQGRKDTGGGDPTTTPVADPETVNHLRTYILNQGWSDSLALVDPTSPQSMAIQQLAIEQAPLDETLQQRYALLVTWFGLGGKGDLVEGHECKWHPLVGCDPDNQAVTSLRFREKGLDGTISEEIAMLTDLTALDLSLNRVRGFLPPALYDLVQLTTLNLAENMFASTISDDIARLTDLQLLNLRANGDFFGTLPSSMKNMTSLTTIQMFRTSLEAPILEFALHWPNLEVLDVTQSSLMWGTIPTELSKLTNFRDLSFADTKITGTIPTEIGLVSTLDVFFTGHLDVPEEENYGLDGTLPSELGDCRKLTLLSFTKSRVSGTIPESFGNLSLLKKVRFVDGRFEGSLPDSLQGWTDVADADFRGNSFNGTLPEWMGHLPLLESLHLEENYFTGSIPSSYCRPGRRIYYDCKNPCDCCGPCGFSDR